MNSDDLAKLSFNVNRSQAQPAFVVYPALLAADAPMRKTILRLLRRLYFFAPLIAVALVCGLMLADPPLVRTLRHALWDQYQRLQPRVYQDTAVRVVDIDEESLSKVGQWPWPRYRIAELVKRLQDLQAAAVGFDVVVAEPVCVNPDPRLARSASLAATKSAAVPCTTLRSKRVTSSSNRARSPIRKRDSRIAVRIVMSALA